MNTTTGPTAGSLDVLVRRLRCMSSVREDESARQRQRGELCASLSISAGADAYARAADELERVIAGEVPPGPGEHWPPNAPALPPGEKGAQ